MCIENTRPTVKVRALYDYSLSNYGQKTYENQLILETDDFWRFFGYNLLTNNRRAL